MVDSMVWLCTAVVLFEQPCLNSSMQICPTYGGFFFLTLAAKLSEKLLFGAGDQERPTGNGCVCRLCVTVYRNRQGPDPVPHRPSGQSVGQ